MIYYAIKPNCSTVTRYVNEGDFNSVYYRILEITNGNHIKSSDAQCWCEVASVGEIYECEQFSIEIIDY